MPSEPALILQLKLTVVLAFALLSLAQAKFIKDVCGTETRIDKEHSRQLVNDDLYDEARNLLEKPSVVYIINCKVGFVRTCQIEGNSASLTPERTSSSSVDTAREKKGITLTTKTGAGVKCTLTCKQDDTADLQCEAPKESKTTQQKGVGAKKL